MERVADGRGAYRILVGKTSWKEPAWKTVAWVGGTKMDLQVMGCRGV